MVSSFSSNAVPKTADGWTPLPLSNRGVDQGVAGTPSDPRDVSSVPTFSKIEQLKGTDPTQFQQVVVDAISQLKAAAEQNSNPFASSYLWGLMNRFQFALDAAASNTTGRVADSTDAS
jgi:hypothetical protein